MEWKEADPIPEECRNCKEADCYNCDVAGKRWILPEEEERRLAQLLMARWLERRQRKG